MAHKAAPSVQDAPKTLRALMAAREIWTFTELARRSRVSDADITRISQGWRGTSLIRSRLARVLGRTPSDILVAALEAHREPVE